MNAEIELHRALARQLQRLHLTSASSPSPAAWAELLDLLSVTYTEADDERLGLRRTIDLSSRELRSLHDDLSLQALQDTLTGLPNRAALIRHLDQ